MLEACYTGVFPLNCCRIVPQGRDVVMSSSVIGQGSSISVEMLLATACCHQELQVTLAFPSDSSSQIA
jgi:hypothetical protein